MTTYSAFDLKLDKVTAHNFSAMLVESSCYSDKENVGYQDEWGFLGVSSLIQDTVR